MGSRCFIYSKKYVIALLVWQWHLVVGELIVSPKDTESSIGERIELRCSSNGHAVEWHYLRPGTNHPEIVYKDGYIFNGYKGRFDAKPCSTVGGECRLVIMSVNLNDAGTYICVENSEESVQNAAKLIVYEQYPSTQFCVSKITCSPECESLELSCNMKHSGNVDAFMEWRDSAGELVPSAIITVNGITTSTVRLDRNHSKSPSYKCQVKYPATNLESRYNLAFKSQDLLASIAGQYGGSQQMTVPTTICLVAGLIAELLGIIGLIGYNIRLRNRRQCKSPKTDPELDPCLGEGKIAQQTTDNENQAIHVGLHVHELSLSDDEVPVSRSPDCLDELQSYSISNNLVVRGLPEMTTAEITSNFESSCEKFDVTCDAVVALCNDRLGVQVTKQDISAAYRIQVGKQCKSRPIVVRFATRGIRDQVYRARVALRESGEKQSPIYINEQLTKKSTDIFYNSRKLLKNKKIAKTWTMNGLVYFKRTSSASEKPIRINDITVVVSQEWLYQLENVAVLVGIELALRCPLISANGSVNWFLYTNGTKSSPMKLTDGIGCLENDSWKYKCSDGNRILIFNCTDNAYAGIYECRMQGKSTSMHITILESDPICNVTNIQAVENNFIEMWCIVNYSGDWAPVMEWGHTVTENTTLEEFNGNVTTHTNNHSVISTLRVLADSRRHNSRYYCKTSFTNSSSVYGKNNFAKNVPTYNNTWISPAIRVLDCPKHFISTQQAGAFTSEILNCSAEADPTTTTLEKPPGGTNDHFFKFAIITGSLISCFIVMLLLAMFAKKIKERCTGWNSIKFLEIKLNRNVFPLADGYSAVNYEEYTDQGAIDPVYSVVTRRSNNGQFSSSLTEEAIQNNSMYMYREMPNANCQTALPENKNNDPDGIIYLELGQVPIDRRNNIMDPSIVREQFEKSEYATIDHSLRVSLPAPQLGFNPIHFC